MYSVVNTSYKRKMKKYIRMLKMLTPVLFALILATGCGKESEDPNAGVYEATTAETSGISVDAGEVFDGGLSIELTAGGRTASAVWHR